MLQIHIFLYPYKTWMKYSVKYNPYLNWIHKFFVVKSLKRPSIASNLSMQPLFIILCYGPSVFKCKSRQFFPIAIFVLCLCARFSMKYKTHINLAAVLHKKISAVYNNPNLFLRATGVRVTKLKKKTQEHEDVPNNKSDLGIKEWNKSVYNMGWGSFKLFYFTVFLHL